MTETKTELQRLTQDFLAYVARERLYSPLTVKAYDRDLKDFAHFVTTYDPEQIQSPERIDRQTIRHFLGYLRERGLGARSVARKLATLKSFFKYLNLAEVIPANPAVGIRTPRFPKPLPDFLPEDQAIRLMELPPEDSLIGLRDRAILETFYAAGIRLAELTGLSVGDISFTRKTIRVMGKGGKERLVPFGEAAGKAVGRYLEARRQRGEMVASESPLFCGRGCKPISARTVQSRVAHYMKQFAEARHLSPHLLRHTVATHLLDRGADLMAVKDLLGHASLTSTQVYTHVKVEQMKKLYRQAHPHASGTNR
ncbi:MAG: tyrosine recombinase XerC [Fidelibacterota bacterium]|nr:MAG: tyrosine recombinase XerC [Candidatus Neomarinimicrobiota bacterium]